MMFSIDMILTVILILFVLKFVFSFGAISAKKTFNLGRLADLGTKMLGYKELYDIATGNNKSGYGDMADNVAEAFLGKAKDKK